MQLLDASATTIEGVIAKLRHGFQNIKAERYAQDAVLDPGSASFRDGLAKDGPPERMIWGAIEDLARIAGVSLTETAA